VANRHFVAQRSVLVASLLAVVASGAACSSDEPPAILENVPDAVRAADDGGDPRSPSYWVTWSTCAEDNRAETAAANGGREAGWLLLDDLLWLPGAALGEVPVETCEQGVAVLEPSEDAPIADRLASQVLAAQLNLAAGSTSCQAAEETVAVAQAVLASVEYEGPGQTADDVDEETLQGMADLSELLALYNSGQLCR
jgi:hypothetical protein